MKIPFRLRFGAALAAALFVFLPAARTAMAPTAPDDSAGQQVATIDVPTGLAAAEVQTAIIQPALHLKWEIQQKTGDRVICHYARGENEATLTIKYDTRQVVIFAVGHARGGGLPMRWIERLRRDIAAALSEQLALKH